MAYQRQKGGVWYAQVWDKAAQKYIRRSSNSKVRRDAEKLEAVIEGEIEERERNRGVASFASVVLVYAERKLPTLAKQTQDAYRRNLRAIIDYHNNALITDITIKTAKTYIAYMRLEQNIGEDAITKRIRVLSSVLSFAAENDFLERNPLIGFNFRLKPPTQREEEYTPEEIKRLLALPMPERTRLFIIIALETGLRTGEIMSIHEECVSFDRNTITLKKTKNGSDHVIPMTKTVAAHIRTHGFHPVTGWLFAHSNGKRLKNIRRSLTTVLREAGITGRFRHDMRRTFGSRLLENGVPLEAVSAMLNHSNITVTRKHYARAKMREKEGAINAINKEPDM